MLPPQLGASKRTWPAQCGTLACLTWPSEGLVCGRVGRATTAWVCTSRQRPAGVIQECWTLHVPLSPAFTCASCAPLLRRQLGLTAIYSGHDHNNDYAGVLEGIR